MNGITLDAEGALAFPLTGIRLIEASAGTGKTYTLANLYLRHIVEGRDVGAVLVVTFTIAATDELRGRIRARLFETLDLLEREGATDDGFLRGLMAQIRERGMLDLAIRRLRLAVRAMDEAAIYTIHSFCQRALTEFAFNSGQQFQMDVLTDDSDLWRQAVQDWWRRTSYSLDQPRARLFRDSLEDLDSFRTLLRSLLGPQQKRLLPEVPSLAIVLARLDEQMPDLAALAELWRTDGTRLCEILLESKGLSRAQSCAYQGDRLRLALANLDGYFKAGGDQPPPECFEVLTAECIAASRTKKLAPELGDPFFARCGRLWQDLARLQRDLRVAALAEATVFARQRVREAKQQAQWLAFDDLLTEMHAALRGPSGDALASAIREQFPVAMIDEFQDTDPVQYGIFRRLYLGRPECGLIMIGDPKQAIYSFRGGDIFTYMQAKADVGRDGAYTLDTNWRSTPRVINAVNALFRHRAGDAFVYAATIPFAPTGPAAKEHRVLSREGEPQPALTLWTLPSEVNAKGEAKPLSKDKARALTHAAVADEIVRLIGAGRKGRARLGDAPLEPRDIAVLVRSSREAAELRQELPRRGVNAVSVEREGVFKSGEAAALQTLLQAVLNPRDRELARLALTSPLLGKAYPEIEGICQGDEEYAAWVDGLLQLHEIWQRRGFMAMFQQLLRTLGIAEALSRGDLAERRLTNLLHLGELLQQAAKGHAGMDALLAWFRQQREESAGEETELRLESDADLVQIVTIHASKGLEYPVVFVPYLWSCKTRGGDGLLGFHREGVACLDAGSEDRELHLRLAERERLAEDVRLAYVALTRAESALYLVWGRAGSRDGHAGQTALGYLLHPGQTGERLGAELPDAFAGVTEVRTDLERLAAAASGDIRVAPLPDPVEGLMLRTDDVVTELAPRLFRGEIATDWRISSFSALTKEVHSGPVSGLAHPHAEVAEDVGLRFPAGSQVGSYLHLLLEKLDFQGDIVEQVLALSAQIAPRFGLDHEQHGQDAADLLARVTRTPLDAEGLSLASLASAQRLNELEFDFATGPADTAGLDRLLQRTAGRLLPPLAVETFQGMVNGVIDLVFEHRGRFFIGDYKSNFLGGQLTDYSGERLEEAMYERRYDLQYLLYTLALHRYLHSRLRDYDYERHFGGIYYLFLRGMRPETGTRYGVYGARPPLAVVEALDRQVFLPQEAV
jgi:exodeoxyribonuclease V beta subunit